MSKREKIILMVMATVVLYGVYSLFFSAPAKVVGTGSAKSIGEIKKFVTEVTTGMKEDYTTRGVFIIEQAKSEWIRDPFLTLRAPQKTAVVTDNGPAAAEIAPEMSYTYSGYIQMGERKLAIINGIEYEAGDELDGGEQIVKRIEPLRVVIGPQNNNDNLTLQLDETGRQAR